MECVWAHSPSDGGELYVFTLLYPCAEMAMFVTPPPPPATSPMGASVAGAEAFTRRPAKLPLSDSACRIVTPEEIDGHSQKTSSQNANLAAILRSIAVRSSRAPFRCANFAARLGMFLQMAGVSLVGGCFSRRGF